ncbi:MAG: lysine-ketoglutarate reductase/saccharopine dehydrogenase-like protein (TIGR00300 family) [Pseudohongiellaceae bacterium]|jgi:lysine-ketoglutarate reductase/saccharopine dehydrogenase-like protein (TIGR00300 family)
MHLSARGHLIDAGLLGTALDAVTGGGGSYRIVSFDVGRTKDEESEILLDVQADDPADLQGVIDNLGTLGFCRPDDSSVELGEVLADGVAPDSFYSSTNLTTSVRVADQPLDVLDQRMDATIVVDDMVDHSSGSTTARCVKLRDLVRGQKVVLGSTGVTVHPDTHRREAADFSFMSSEISSERRVDDQAALLAGLWREAKAGGGRVVLVGGPVIIHTGQAEALSGMISRGWVDALLAGNALAVHDVEAATLGTSLGISQCNGRAELHGHMNHMRAINLVRKHGGLAGAVGAKVLTRGVMYACVRHDVPFSLAGSIRDDGPLPDTEMDLIAAQERYSELLKGASLVVVLGTMLHGIGVGNMLPAGVQLVCVDINPAVASKLCDRGSSHTVAIVTDVGLFMAILSRHLSDQAPVAG